MKCRAKRNFLYTVLSPFNLTERIMIPLVEEPKEHFEEFRMYENCYFECGRKTKFWHWRTNQPICKECAKNHKVSEVEKCTPKYKPPTKEEYMKSL